MVISNLLSKIKTTSAEGQIVLQPFVDLYLDTIGWYALGHHKPQDFLKAVAQKEPHAKYSLAQVQLTWAKIEGKEFEITEIPVSESQAITIIESW